MHLIKSITVNCELELIPKYSLSKTVLVLTKYGKCDL